MINRSHFIPSFHYGQNIHILFKNYHAFLESNESAKKLQKSLFTHPIQYTNERDFFENGKNKCAMVLW